MAIIGGTMLTGGVGNMVGSPIGAMSLLVINEIIRAAGINSNYQAIISGLLLCVFIVLQSAVVWIRGSSRFKFVIPIKFTGTKKEMSGTGRGGGT